ncbi:ectoine/hydroxyectoine ABC transporter substrate-binding protein EhuB [Sinorhizobium mexicanum]|uniref:Ectoine/hydroxyectoine ABC transporter substrate-binding protein EhuB n=1 Tax=Sinorhizobium mexicanum TaxID=375549 RepID=A0A859R461_9HYPH|nr:ectoine/hydroxyectoine ABC transporter substrate-binding protein EhuB [Sinorhizobium mexicanum]MBP1885141.1 polar amino acid transport system substrate-binding protein [Sinorhizobium mexicanum]QLL64398.1 ectoine/hydroxyectoine ABC transporter substrate-binding protein EhuB [Sinorhizobium mexicanum]
MADRLTYKFCKAILSCAVLSALSISFVAGRASADDALEKIKEKGIIKSGVANEAPWMIINPDGNLSGVGPDIDKEALAATGVTNYQAQAMDYGAMIPALQVRRIDIISSGALFIKPKRCEQVIYSDPVLCNSAGFMLTKGLEGKIQSYEDVARANLRIGIAPGGYEARYAAKAGIPQENIVPIPDGVSAVKMLQDKRIDLIALPDASLETLRDQVKDPNLVVFFPVKNTPMGCAGAAFNKEDVALRDLYNEGLKKIVANGKYAEMMTKYGLASRIPLREGQTTAALCASEE